MHLGPAVLAVRPSGPTSAVSIGPNGPGGGTGSAGGHARAPLHAGCRSNRRRPSARPHSVPAGRTTPPSPPAAGTARTALAAPGPVTRPAALRGRTWHPSDSRRSRAPGRARACHRSPQPRLSARRGTNGPVGQDHRPPRRPPPPADADGDRSGGAPCTTPPTTPEAASTAVARGARRAPSGRVTVLPHASAAPTPGPPATAPGRCAGPRDEHHRPGRPTPAARRMRTALHRHLGVHRAGRVEGRRVLPPTARPCTALR